MSMHTIKGYLVWRQFEFQDRPDIEFVKYKPVPCTSERLSELGLVEVLVREHEFEVEVPDDFDPTGDVIAQLEQHKQQLRAKLTQQLIVLDERISKLRALPMAAPTPTGSTA